jgi:hypothetical protein
MVAAAPEIEDWYTGPAAITTVGFSDPLYWSQSTTWLTILCR